MQNPTPKLRQTSIISEKPFFFKKNKKNPTHPFVDIGK